MLWLVAAFPRFPSPQAMLKTAEDLCGPYVWGIYDILVLPPSFPYGGKYCSILIQVYNLITIQY